MSRSPLFLSAGLLSLAIVIGSALISHAGPLDPPAGPVASSYKTLTEVEPRIAINATNTPGDATSIFRINTPGSYYLTGDVQGVSGKNGIIITVPNVTVDLNGFRLNGGAGTLRGIFATTFPVVIRNGTFNQWGMEAVSTSLQAIIENIHILNGTGDGILASNMCQVRNCTVFGASGRGIVAASASEITNCNVAACTGNGIDASACLVSGCIVNNSGIGINATSVSTILDCDVQANKGDGIRISSSSLVRGNTCGNNGVSVDGAGIRVLGTDASLEHNQCTNNDIGIRIEGGGNIITGNRCSGNSINNYDIAASNRYGPIVNITGGGSASATGNSAPSTLSSTDPWANFAY